MKLGSMIARALKGNPEAASAIPDSGAAIVYTVNDEVFTLKINMGGERLEEICRHIGQHGAPRTVTSKIA